MATANDGATTYTTSGAGGKLRKRPLRRTAPATPYDRPNTATRNKSPNPNPSLFAKLVDPASRLLYAGADRLFGVFRKRMPPVAQRLTGTSEEPRNGSPKAVPNSAVKSSTGVVEPSTNEGGNLASISVATEISDLENMLKHKTFTRSEIERLTALLLSKTTESNAVEGNKEKLPSTSYRVPRPDAFTSVTLNKHVEERETGNFDAAISTPVVNSRAFEDDGASPAELAKAYMGTRSTKLSPVTMRPSSQALRQDLVLLNNTATFPKTPTTSLTPKTAVAIKTSENNLTTFRSRGRSALYNMPRTPYYRGPSTLSQKGVASPSAWEHEGSIGSSRMAAKRRSTALDDIGSGGPMRRIRQKANLLSQQSSFSKHTSELGSSQKLLLRNEPEPKGSKAVEETGEISKRNQSYGSVPTESSKMALKIFEQLERMSPKEKRSGSKLVGTTEKIDSPKLLSSSQDNKKSEGQNRVLFSDARESTLQNKDKVEENGPRNIVGYSNILSSVNKNSTVPVSGDSPIVTKAGSTTKRAFTMSAHEDSLELDDDNHSNGHLPISPGENKKSGTSSLANNDVSSGVRAEISQTSTPPKVSQTTLPEVKAAISPGGSNFNNQKTSFNFSASTSSTTNTHSSVLSQPSSKVDTVAPQNKPTVFPTFGISAFNSAEPSEVKTNISPDAKPLSSTSLINSTMNNDQVQPSASNKDNNGNTHKPANLFGNLGSSSSANLTTASASGFSLGGSSITSAIINGTSASSPSSFAFSSSFQPSGTTTNNVFSSGSSPALSSTTTAFMPSTAAAAATTTAPSGASSASPTSMPASVFKFASTTASSTSASTTSPFASTPLTTSSNGGSIFGLSSSSATLTTNGFQASTQAASTAVTQAVPFKFGSGSTGMPSSTSAGSLFSSSASSFGLTSTVTSSEIKPGGSTSSFTTNISSSGFSSTPSFGLSSTVASSETKSGSSPTGIFASGFSSTPSFGLSSTVTSSETKSGNSTANVFGSGFGSTPSSGLNSTVASSETKSGSTTSNIFGSTAFSFGASSTASMPAAASSPFMFGSSNAGASTGSSVFGSPAPVFGTSPTNNNDQMSMEDSMVDDSNQTPPTTPSVPAFGQASSGTPGFMFGSTPTPTTPSAAPFQFGGQTNQLQPGSTTPPSAVTFQFGGQTNQPQPGLTATPSAVPFQFGGQTNQPQLGSTRTPSAAPFQFGGQTNPPQQPFSAGGSFSLGSGGDDKSNRRIVKVRRQQPRRK